MHFKNWVVPMSLEMPEWLLGDNKHIVYVHVHDIICNWGARMRCMVKPTCNLPSFCR